VQRGGGAGKRELGFWVVMAERVRMFIGKKRGKNGEVGRKIKESWVALQPLHSKSGGKARVGRLVGYALCQKGKCRVDSQVKMARLAKKRNAAVPRMNGVEKKKG